MDFTLSEEHLMVQKMVRDYCEKEVAPIIKEADRSQTMHPSILPRLGELGLLGICIPERYGGQGFDYVTLGLVCEELEACDTSLRVIMSVHMGLNSLALLQWGTEEQKQRFLVPQARGVKYAMFGLTEPGVGSDVVGMASTARRDGDNYIINGEKMWISLATKAHHILWVARTNPEAKDPHDQLSAFIIEADSPGLTTRRHPRQAGRARRLHRLGELRRRARAGRQPPGRRGRGLQDRHVVPGQRPLHGRLGRRRPHPRLAGGQRALRQLRARPLAARSASTSWCSRRSPT